MLDFGSAYRVRALARQIFPLNLLATSKPRCSNKVMKKRCGSCGKNREERFFNRKRASGLQPYCRDCQRDKAREHYTANREYYLEKANRHRLKLKTIIHEAKSRPCADCGSDYPYYVMDFDHREGKEFNLGGAHTRKSIQAIIDEIEKCDVVCANCHRERTYNRKPDVII
jgi:hypothetical protein